MRIGLLAKKVGMTKVFRGNVEIPVTVLDVAGNVVLQKRTDDKDGYEAAVIGFGAAKKKNINKPQLKLFENAKSDAKGNVAEFRSSKTEGLNVGDEILPSHFVEGQFVDVSGTNIGKGFAGGMKRHNFGGLEATHGVSISHRSHGSTGHCQDPGRVFKGKKMAGHMGNVKVTQQNLEVVSVDEELGVILVKGAVPGAKGGVLRVTDSVKRAVPFDVPTPAAVKGAGQATEAQENNEQQNEG